MNSLPIKDDNDRLLEGTLPQDPFSDAELLDPAAPDTATNEDQNWPDPLPISPVSNVPVFPVDTLPPWLRDWVTALATALQCPVDLPAMLGLAVLALCAAKRYQAHVIQGWDEPLNLYVAVALKPGESKSPAFAAAIRPVSRFVTEEHRRTDPEIRAAIARADVAAKRTDHLKTRAAKATAPEEYAKSLALVEEAVLEHASIDVPVPLRLVLDDVTAESLEAVLRHQGGRIALMSDEGGPFELMGGRYSNGIPNIDVYLKGHSGNQITTDRIGREGGSIQEPAITIGLAIQPDIIASLRDKKGFRGRGLLARFLWAIPESLVGRRAPDAPPVPLEVSQAYEDAVTSLLRRPTRRDETGEIKSRPMDFSAAAYELVVGLKAKNEPKLGLAGEFEDVADWGNKLAGETVRIAGLLQLADHALEPDASAPLGVGTDPMRRALRITEYLVTPRPDRLRHDGGRPGRRPGAVPPGLDPPQRRDQLHPARGLHAAAGPVQAARRTGPAPGPAQRPRDHPPPTRSAALGTGPPAQPDLRRESQDPRTECTEITEFGVRASGREFCEFCVWVRG
jgi:replicative DNA helicase